jgi:hypothetical protein
MRNAALLVALVLIASPGLAKTKDKVVKLRVGPFPIEAKRDREICQAIRVPDVGGMEIASYEVRTRLGDDVGSHHLVIYGYAGTNAAAFPARKNERDVVDVPGCNGFGPDDFFRDRVQLAGSGGEFRRGKWATTSAQTPLGLATLLPANGPTGDAMVIVNSHYFNRSSKRAKGVVKVVLKLRPFDGSRRIVRTWTPLDASLDISVPPHAAGVASSTIQADGAADENVEGGFRPSSDVCVLLMTTHTHARGTNVKVVYEEDGKDPVTLIDPAVYDYEHPALVALPFTGTFPNGNLLKAYTAENGHPRLRYTCSYANGGGEYGVRMGCEESDGVTPGIPWRDAIAAGMTFGNARPCGQANTHCEGYGTGRCVESNLVFGPLSDDEMCVIPLQIYDPLPGVPAEQACNPF